MKNEAEQGIWNEYSRLIEKPIIHYSMQLLSREYEQIAAHDHARLQTGAVYAQPPTVLIAS